MMDWQVGDLALALASPHAEEWAHGSGAVCAGEILRVDKVIGWMHQTGLGFEGRPSDHPTGTYDAAYFRKIRPDEHEACEDEFVELLNRSKQPEKLPMSAALARFGDVPTSFVMREMMFERDYRELERWVRVKKEVGNGQ
jgi:hypothetical protein